MPGQDDPLWRATDDAGGMPPAALASRAESGGQDMADTEPGGEWPTDADGSPARKRRRRRRKPGGAGAGDAAGPGPGSD